MNPLRTLLRPPTVRAGLAAPATIVFAALVAMVSCATVPLTGRHQLLLLSEGQEVQMGLDAYREVLKNSKLSTDPVATEQVRRVGRRIAEATGRTDYQWEFSLIEDKQVNAFCLPGGKVAVYTGLLPITGDDARLAAVLGHEVAHAIARHGGERVSQGLIVQVGLTATQAALERRWGCCYPGAAPRSLRPTISASSSWPRRATTLTRRSTSGIGWPRLRRGASARPSSCPPIRRNRRGSLRSRPGFRRPCRTTVPADPTL